MTLKDHICETIRTNPGITGAEIVRRLPFGPSRHQQVNARCRQLADDGKIIRQKMANAFIGNYPNDRFASSDKTHSVSGRKPAGPASSIQHAPLSGRHSKAVPATTLAIAFRWHSAGEVQIESNDRLSFPRLTSVPGLYRFRFASTRRLYIGESANLPRRMRNYRSGNPSQSTSHWVHNAHKAALSNDELVLVDVCTEIEMTRDNGALPTVLASKPIRRFAENAAITNEMQGKWTLLNRDAQ